MLHIKIFILFLFIVVSQLTFAQTESIDKVNVEEIISNKKDSITVTIFVDFIVEKNGTTSEVFIDKTECSEIRITEKEKLLIDSVKNNVVLKIEKQQFKSVKNPVKYLIPLKVTFARD